MVTPEVTSLAEKHAIISLGKEPRKHGYTASAGQATLGSYAMHCVLP